MFSHQWAGNVAKALHRVATVSLSFFKAMLWGHIKKSKVSLLIWSRCYSRVRGGKCLGTQRDATLSCVGRPPNPFLYHRLAEKASHAPEGQGGGDQSNTEIQTEIHASTWKDKHRRGNYITAFFPLFPRAAESVSMICVFGGRLCCCVTTGAQRFLNLPQTCRQTQLLWFPSVTGWAECTDFP